MLVEGYDVVDHVSKRLCQFEEGIFQAEAFSDRPNNNHLQILH